MAKHSAPKLTKLNPPERVRTYIYADGDDTTELTFKDVTAFAASERGTHRLKCKGVRGYYIVPAGFKALHVDVDKFTL